MAPVAGAGALGVYSRNALFFLMFHCGLAAEVGADNLSHCILCQFSGGA